jgi:hypothetical protein
MTIRKVDRRPDASKRFALPTASDAIAEHSQPPALTATNLETLVGNALALSHAVRVLAATITASSPTRSRAALREAHARCVDALTAIETIREVLLARGGAR